MDDKLKSAFNICDECSSAYYAESSMLEKLCPECAHLLYGYPHCDHLFENGRCSTCYWDGSTSEYLQKIKGK